MSSSRGVTGLHAVCQCWELAVCHRSGVTSDPCQTANQGALCSINTILYHINPKNTDIGPLVYVEPGHYIAPDT